MAIIKSGEKKAAETKAAEKKAVEADQIVSRTRPTTRSSKQTEDDKAPSSSQQNTEQKDKKSESTLNTQGDFEDPLWQLEALNDYLNTIFIYYVLEHQIQLKAIEAGLTTRKAKQDSIISSPVLYIAALENFERDGEAWAANAPGITLVLK